MYVLIDHDEHRMLVELVESRIRELQPEIRRCQDSQYQEELQGELQRLHRLARHLHESECDVTA